jgi:predicted DNA-binding protein (MmcQ/YjbR family)
VSGTTFDDVRRIALSLPEAEEILTWETDVTFRIRKKIFAIGGEEATRISIKASPQAQADLIDRDPETFAVAAYVGRFGWVTADLGRIGEAQLRDLLLDAWRLTAPKRLAATLSGGLRSRADEIQSGEPDVEFR